MSMMIPPVKTSTTMSGADGNWFALVVDSLRDFKGTGLHDSRTISVIRNPDDTYTVYISVDYQNSHNGTPIPRRGTASITVDHGEIDLFNVKLAELRGEA